MWKPNIKSNNNNIKWLQVAEQNGINRLNLQQKEKLMDEIKSLVSKLQSAFTDVEITEDKVIEMLKIIGQKYSTELRFEAQNELKHYYRGVFCGMFFAFIFYMCSFMTDIDVVKKHIKGVSDAELAKFAEQWLIKVLATSTGFGVLSLYPLLRSYFARKRRESLRQDLLYIGIIEKKFKESGITPEYLDRIARLVVMLGLK